MTRENSARSRKILIVEDEEMVQKFMGRLLSMQHEVDICGDGLDVLDQFEPGRYDVAFIDLGLPRLPGDQVANKIRELDPQIALVLITGWIMESSDQRLSVFDFILRKPFDNLDELYTVTDRAICLRDSRGVSHER